MFVEVQARSGEERRAQPVVSSVMQPEEVEPCVHTRASVGARSQGMGFERRPLKPMVGVKTPPVVAPERRQPMGDGSLLLRGKRHAGNRGRDVGGCRIASIERHVAGRSEKY